MKVLLVLCDGPDYESINYSVMDLTMKVLTIV